MAEATRPTTERVYSRDPEVFGVPSGREEDWRFTPLVRLRPLLEPFFPDAGFGVAGSAWASVATWT